MRVTILKCTPKMIFPIVGWGIQLVEQTSFSHYAIDVNGFVFDSSSKGVRLTNIEEFVHRYNIKETIELSDFNQELSICEIFDWFKEYALGHYGYIQNFIILLKRLRIIKTQYVTSGTTCSELVMMFLKEFYDKTIQDVNVGLIEVEEYFISKGFSI